MTSRKLSRMKLDPYILKKLSSRNIITAGHLFRKTTLELIELGFSLDEANTMLNIVSTTIIKSPKTAFELYIAGRDMNYLSLSSNCKALQIRGITEFVGAAGMGKTQICFMLSVMTALPVEHGGLGGSVIYIDTESSFSPSRLVEIAQKKYPKMFQSEEAIKILMSQVVVYSPSSSKELKERICNLQVAIIENNAKLIVVDSVAAPVRIDYDAGNLLERSAILGKIASILKYLGETFNIPVVVTNQVTTTYSNGDPNRGSSIAAALGPTWAHSVTTRFILKEKNVVRILEVAKSPLYSPVTYIYCINEKGCEIIG